MTNEEKKEREKEIEKRLDIVRDIISRINEDDFDKLLTLKRNKSQIDMELHNIEYNIDMILEPAIRDVVKDELRSKNNA